MTGHARSREHSRREAGCADGAGSAMEHGPVTLVAAAEMMALDDRAKAATLTDPNHVDLIVWLEFIHQYAVALLHVAVARVQPQLAHQLRTLGVGLLEMARLRFVGAR